MQELTPEEMEQVGGGFLDIAIEFFRAISSLVSEAEKRLDPTRAETAVGIRG